MPKLLSLHDAIAEHPAAPLAAGHHERTTPLAKNGSVNGRTNGEVAFPQFGVTATAPELEDSQRWTPDCGKGVSLAVDQDIEERFLSAQRIAIDFPAFNDGRGLSLAVLLRSRHGYAGDIVATGDVHEDMLHYLRRCGFTSFLIPDERNLETARSTLAPYSDYYQASVVEPEPAFRRIGRGG